MLTTIRSFRALLLVAGAMGCSAFAAAQDDPPTPPPTADETTVEEGTEEFETPPADDGGPEVELGDMVITATRGMRRAVEVPLATGAVSPLELSDRMPQSTPEALEEEVGVLIQKTNQGGGSPIIRGRSGKSILLLIDGQRFNNATFRRNNQYLNTLDLGAIERLEVVRGPASVLYGSDAMGGAINVITERHEPTGDDTWTGRLFGQYESANDGFTAHLGLAGEVAGFGLRGGVSAKDFGDLRAGRHGDPIGAVDIDGVQDPTAYTELDWNFSAVRRLTDTDTVDFLFLQSRQEDVPRSDRLIANDNQPTPPDLRRDFAPQILRWYALRWTHEEPEHSTRLLERFELTASLNHPTEGRRRIRSSDPTTQIEERDEVLTPALAGQFQLRPAEAHTVITGFSASYESIDSSRETLDRTTGVRTPAANGRFPDKARYQSYGLYVQDEWTLADGWTWTNGVRYSRFRVDLDLDDLTVGPVGPFGRLREAYDDVTWSTALSHQLREKVWVYGSVARGFRAPNLDDLAVLGDFSSGERVPNLDLDPESVLNFELGVKTQGHRVSGGASASLALYRDLFDTVFAFDLSGDDVFRVENTGRARIVTLEGWFQAAVRESDGLTAEHSLFGQGFATWGRNTSEDEPVRRVPPAQALLGYRVEDGMGLWTAEGFVRGSLRQDRLSPGDEADPRIPLDGTPGWLTWNLRGSYEVRDGLVMRLALENITDRRYRVHGSGIDAAGSNIVLGVDWRF